MEVTETATEPEAEQSEADQMRDTEVGSAAAATTQNIQEIPDWAEMTRAQRNKWKKWGGQGR